MQYGEIPGALMRELADGRPIIEHDLHEHFRTASPPRNLDVTLYGPSAFLCEVDTDIWLRLSTHLRASGNNLSHLQLIRALLPNVPAPIGYRDGYYANDFGRYAPLADVITHDDPDDDVFNQPSIFFRSAPVDVLYKNMQDADTARRAARVVTRMGEITFALVAEVLATQRQARQTQGLQD